MGITAHPDGALEIRPHRTRARAAFALFLILPLALSVVFLGCIAIDGQVWTWPLGRLSLVLAGVLLNPGTLAALMGAAIASMWWDGTSHLTRDGRFVVYRKLLFRRWGIPHRVDVERLGDLTVSVERYPRDDSDADWRTSFRPRVVLRNGSSQILGLGDGLSVAEAEILATEVSEMLGLSGGSVEPAD